MCKPSALTNFLFSVCACLNFGLSLTLLMSMNALFPDWLTHFEASRGATSAIQATGIGVTLGAGLIAGLLERKFGERRSLLLGTFLSTVGLFSGSYAPSLPVLIVCLGVVSGCGFCLLHLSTLSVTLRRFPNKAGFMSSVMSSTSAVFHLVTPLLYRYMAEEFTWRGCLLVASAIALHTAIFSLLITSPVLQPAKGLPTSSPEEEITLCVTANDHSENTTGFALQRLGSQPDARKPCPEGADVEIQADVALAAGAESGCSHVHLDTKSSGNTRVRYSNAGEAGASDVNAATDKSIFQDSSLLADGTSGYAPQHSMDERAAFLQPPPSSDKREDASLVSDNDRGEHLEASESTGERQRGKTMSEKLKANASFLKSPLYVCVLLFTVAILSTIFSFVFLVLDFASNNGWTVQQGVLLNFVFMLSGLLSRILGGVVSLHPRVRSTALLVGAGVIGSVGLCSVGQVHTLPLAALFYACMGAGLGVTVGIAPPAVLDVTGPRAYPVGLGLMCTVEGTMDTAVTILTGTLVDLLQSYSMLSLVYGLISFVFTILLLVVFLLRR